MNTSELTLAGINVPDLMQRIMNNEMLLKLILKKFCEDTTYNDLVGACADRTREAMEHTSHTLKGMCGNLSHTALYRLFTDQVTLIREGDIDGATALMPAISAEYDNAVSHIKKWFE